MALKRLTIIVWLCALCYIEQGLTVWNVPAPLMVLKQWGSTPSISLDTLSALHLFIQLLMVKQHAGHEGHKRVKDFPIRPNVAQPCSKELKLLLGGPGMEVDDQPCPKELKLLLGGPGMEVEDLLIGEGHRESILGLTGRTDGVLMRSRVSHTTASQVERAEEAALQRTAGSDAVHRVGKEAERYGAIVWVISFYQVCLLVSMGLLARITVRILLQKAEVCEGQQEWDLPESCFSTLIQNRTGLHAASRRRRKGKGSCKG